MYASYIGIGDFYFLDEISNWALLLGFWNSGLAIPRQKKKKIIGLAKYISSMDLYFWILIGKEVESLD